MECISSNNTVSRVNAKMIKMIIMEMCCNAETTSLTLMTNGDEPKHLQADDMTTVYNMCVFTNAIEDTLNRDGVAVVVATYGLAGNKSRILVVLLYVNES